MHQGDGIQPIPSECSTVVGFGTTGASASTEDGIWNICGRYVVYLDIVCYIKFFLYSVCFLILKFGDDFTDNYSSNMYSKKALYFQVCPKTAAMFDTMAPSERKVYVMANILGKLGVKLWCK